MQRDILCLIKIIFKIKFYLILLETATEVLLADTHAYTTTYAGCQSICTFQVATMLLMLRVIGCFVSAVFVCLTN